MKNVAEANGRQEDGQDSALSSSVRRLLAEKEAELELSERSFLALAHRDSQGMQAKLGSEALAARRQMTDLIESLEELAEVKQLQFEENLRQHLGGLDKAAVVAALESSADANLPVMLGFMMVTAQYLRESEKPAYFVQRQLERTVTDFLDIFGKQGYLLAEGQSPQSHVCQISENDFQELLHQLAQEYRTHFPHAHCVVGTSSIST